MSELESMPAAEWQDLEKEEKIEILRRALKVQANLLKQMTEYINKLMDHEHLNGKMVSRIKYPNEEGYGGLRYPDYLDRWL